MSAIDQIADHLDRAGRANMDTPKPPTVYTAGANLTWIDEAGVYCNAAVTVTTSDLKAARALALKAAAVIAEG